MSPKTISLCQGKGSLSHNNRTFKPKNVDSTKSENNVTFIKIPIAEAYDNCFKEAVERYNEKQTRNDRRINKSYYESVFNHKPCDYVITAPDKRKSFYEDIVQIGCKDDTGVGTPDADLAAACLIEYMHDFPKRNPNLYVFNAVLHMDEATPHLHIDYIPIGHYKRGIDTQNGIAQALKEMGYGEGQNAISRWRSAEYNVLRKICEKHGVAIGEPKKSRGYTYTVEQYKQHKDTINALEQKCKSLSDELDELKKLNETAESVGIESSKVPFNKRVVAEEEFEKLEAAKKTTAIKESELEQREATIVEKEKAISARSAELDDSFHKIKMLEMNDQAYQELLPKFQEEKKRREKAEKELEIAENKIKITAENIATIVMMNNCLLARSPNRHADLYDDATPQHQTLADVIRVLFVRLLKALGFEELAKEMFNKAGFSTEMEAEFCRLEQRKGGIER